jgi:peptidoglycan/LPS O-acetylase OafA/YrhL
MVVVYGSRYSTEGLNGKKFVVNRFARIYPAYFFALLLSLQGAYSWIKSVGIPPSLNVPIFVISKLTMTDGWYLGALEAKKSFAWMQQGWSLSTELLFYILFPVILPRIIRLKPVGAGIMAAAAIGVGIAVTYLIRYLATIHGGLIESLCLGESGYSPPANLPPFFLGMAAGLLILRYGPILQGQKFLRVTIVVIAFLFQSLTAESQLPQWQFVGLQCCYTLLIFSLGLEFYQPRVEKPSLFKKSFIALGEASYSIYLLQAAVTSWLSLILIKAGLLDRGASQSWPVFTISFILTATLATIVWKTFETPARMFLQRRLLGDKAGKC